MNTRDASVIGYGRFGSYIHRFLENNEKTNILFDEHDMSPRRVQSFMDRIKIVFICVPIRQFEKVIETIKPMVTEEHVLIDTLSVKCHPRDVLEKHGLSKQGVLTHPMFGPQSAPQGPLGQRLVTCSELTPEIKNLLFAKLGMIQIESTPEEHDREVAKSQLINHIVGRAAHNVGISRTKFSTLTHDKFMSIVDVVNGNSLELFEDMMRYNPFAEKEIQSFVNEINLLKEEILTLKL